MIESKIVVLKAPRELVFNNEVIDDKSICENGIICETLYTAISPGTELAAFNGLPPLRPTTKYPRLLGYCNVSRVLKVGKLVSLYEVGDRVLTFASHRSHFLTSEKSILAKIPEDVNTTHASCAYLFHIGYDSMLRTNVRYGSPIVIFGLGVLGLGAVAMGKNSGATVYAVSNHYAAHKIALKFGAHAVYDRNTTDELIKSLGNRLADTVISTTNSWSDWRTCMSLVGERGSIGVIGFPGRGEDIPKLNPLESEFFYDKQISISSLGLAPESNDKRKHLKFNEKDNLKFILSEMKNGNINPSFLISGEYDWDKIDDAYMSLNSRDGSPLTYVLKWKE